MSKEKDKKHKVKTMDVPLSIYVQQALFAFGASSLSLSTSIPSSSSSSLTSLALAFELFVFPATIDFVLGRATSHFTFGSGGCFSTRLALFLFDGPASLTSFPPCSSRALFIVFGFAYEHFVFMVRHGRQVTPVVPRTQSRSPLSHFSHGGWLHSTILQVPSLSLISTMSIWTSISSSSSYSSSSSSMEYLICYAGGKGE